MYSPFNAANHSPAIAIQTSTINNIASTAQVVPAKRKRATTAVPGHAHGPGQQHHQHQQLQQQQHHQQQSGQQMGHPTLSHRSYSTSAYAHIQHQPAPAFTSPLQQQPPPPSAGSSTLQNSTNNISNNNNGSNHIAGGNAENSASGTEDIHCICGYTDDDGYTIACDDCGRWSHMVCFDISVGKDPEEWRCWECAPRPVNRERARERQAARVAAQARLGPFVGTPEAAALAQAESRQRKRRDRRTSVIAAPNLNAAHAPPLSASHSGGAGDPGNEDEHIDILDDWRNSYVPITEDLIPQATTRTKLRMAAQKWRGVTALSPEEPELTDPGSNSNSNNAKTKVVPLPNGKDDVAAAVRPPSYGLQTTTPIPKEVLITPFASTVVPSAQYLADPLNGYAQMGLPKPHVHLVPPPLSVALDARMAGNEARFIRSGCRPNAVLRPVLCPSKQTPNGNDNSNSNSNRDNDGGDDNIEPGVVKFAVFALRDLKASEEVVLSWEWDDGAVVHQLPALIEEGLRSGVNGAGPSKMTPHHIERLRLQMHSIVESLKSSFVTCACGSAARDCAVRLMEAFAEGEIPWLNGLKDKHRGERQKSPKVSRMQNNAQPAPTPGPSRHNNSAYFQQQRQRGSGSPPHQQSTPHHHHQHGQHLHQHLNVHSHSMSASQPSSSSSSSTQVPSSTNRHPASLNEMQDLARYSTAKYRARLFGPLVGAERGVKTKVIGGEESGGLKGVQQVSGDRWDRFGELDVVVDVEEQGVPEVRVERPSPMKDRTREKGKGVLRGPNGVGLGTALNPPYGEDRATSRSRSRSPIRSSLEPEAGTAAGDEEDVSPLPVVEKEEKMPPRMRKRWIQQKSETLKNGVGAVDRGEESVGTGGLVLGIPCREAPVSPDGMDVDGVAKRPSSRRRLDRTPTPQSAPSHEQRDSMDVDLDMRQMPPPPPPTASSTSSRVSPQLSAAAPHPPPISTSASSTASSAPSQRSSQGRSSLFSLLNDQPLSPIQSNRYLAQVMNPPTPMPAPVPVTTPALPLPPSTSVQSVPSPDATSANVEPGPEAEPVAALVPEPVEEDRQDVAPMLEIEEEREEEKPIEIVEQPQPSPLRHDLDVESRRSEPPVTRSPPPVDDHESREPTPAPAPVPEPVPVLGEEMPTTIPESREEEVEVEAITERLPSPSPTPAPAPVVEEEPPVLPLNVEEPTPTPASPSVHSVRSSREPTPTPILTAAVLVSARSPSPSPVPVVVEDVTMSARSPSPDVDVGRGTTEERPTSPESTGQGMPTHDIHNLAVQETEAISVDAGAGPDADTNVDILEGPEALFKEELMQAAAEAELAKATGGGKTENADEDQDEGESMTVDASLQKTAGQESSSGSLSSSPSPARSVSVLPEPENKGEEEMEVEVKVEVQRGVDEDEEMHDVQPSRASESASLSHVQQKRSASLTPSVEVQAASPPRSIAKNPVPVSVSVSPRRSKSISQSPVVEARTWISPEPDSYEEKQAILAAASVVAPAPAVAPFPAPPEPSPAPAPVADHVPPVNDTNLLASPNLLRAPSPSPSVSVGSSAAVRPTPPPFTVPSDTEHDHEVEHTQAPEQSQEKTQAKESTSVEAPKAATAPAAPPEPQKIRRSMADYRQRKRKQREEEAAKAALASPVSPTSPLQQELPSIAAVAVSATSEAATTEAEKQTTKDELEKRKELEGVNQNGDVEDHGAQKNDLASSVDKVIIPAEPDAVRDTSPIPMSTAVLESPKVHNQEVSLEKTSPKREVSEERVDFSSSPELVKRELTAPKLDNDYTDVQRAHSPPLSPTSVRSKGRPTSPQPTEDGEIVSSAPPRTATPPTAPRALKSASESPSIPPATISSFSNLRSSRPSAPPTQPRSFRDDRRIPSTSPPPRHTRDRDPPPPLAPGKSKLGGWSARETLDKDKKTDGLPPSTVRRASSYVPAPPKPSSSAASGTIASAGVSTTGLRGPPPSGPRALRGAPSGPARTQPPPPAPRAPLAERVERDRSRERDRERDKERERDRDHRDRDRDRERDREYDSYSPSIRGGRYGGRSRSWRGRR